MITLILTITTTVTLSITHLLYDPSHRLFEYTANGVTTDCTGITSFRYDNNTATVVAGNCSLDKVYANGFEL